MDVRFRLASVILAVFVSACSSGQPVGPEAGRALVEESAAAMGGWAALDGIKSQEIITGGADWETLQATALDADARQLNTFGQTLLVDFEKKRMRLGFDAARVYPFPQPVKFTEVVDGEAGMLQFADAEGKVVTERLHPSRHATRLRDLNRLPLRILYTAKNAPDLRREEDKPGEKTPIHVLKFTDSGLPVELQLDSFNKLPVRVIYTEDDPVEGDSVNEVHFTGDWRENSGVRLPQTIATYINGRKLREERIRTLINNPKYDEAQFAIPAEVRAQPEIGERIVSQWPLRRIVNGVGYADFGREQKVDLVQISPGVFHVTGSSHHSMVVELKDGLVVIEMPLFEERSVAVLRALEEKFPGKPVKYGVITHFHMDHSGGIRAYAAKGVTLVAHESVAPWVKTMLERPKTIRPDTLAKAGGTKGTVEAVGDLKTITDGEKIIEIRNVPNPHSQGMLVAYLPKEKLVFVSDLYTPGTPPQPGDQSSNAYAFYAALVKANLSPDRIVGGHGAVGPFRDLAKLMANEPKPGG